MSFNAAQQAGTENRRRAPVLDPGTYPARLVGLLTFGIQAQRPYQGQEKPPIAELHTTYELVDEFMPDEDGNPDESKPRWLSETLAFHNLAADKAKSTVRYLALDPEQRFSGDWSALIGAGVNLSIAVREGKGANVGKKFENISATSAMRPKESAKLPALVNPPRVFDFYSPDLDVFLSLPEWVQNKMKEALDYPGSKLEALVAAHAGTGENPKPKEETKAKAKPKAPVEDDEDEEGDW